MEKFVGIDVSKNFFDVCLGVKGKIIHFDYTKEQVEKCVGLIEDFKPELIVMEATGGYEIDLASSLQENGLPVAVVNPRRIRDFAKAAGQMAKTDAIDAAVIALFASALKPPKAEKVSENARRIRALTARRNQLIRLRTAENNRLEHVFDKSIAKSIKAVICVIDKQLDEVEKQIAGCIEHDPQMKEKSGIIKTMPGIGDTTSAMIVAELPELGRLNRREIASLIGVAPMNRDSGIFRGKRMTGGGRSGIRTCLFMPTLVAIRYNPAVKNFYERLLKAGKTKMTAIVACMRKIITILNSMVANNQPWRENLTNIA
jgi:transposase